MTKPHTILAHSEGHTFLEFKKDGSSLFTCDTFGSIRYFASSKEHRNNESETFQLDTDSLTSLTYAADGPVYFSSSDKSVRSYDLKTENCKIIVRARLQINMLKLLNLNIKGNREEVLAILSDELSLQMYSLKHGTNYYLEGLREPAISIISCKNGNEIIVLTNAGNIHKFDTHNLSQPSFSKRNITYSTRSTPDSIIISSHPSDKFIAIPGLKYGISLYSLNFEQLIALEYKDLKFSQAHVSPDGQFIAGISGNVLVIFNTKGLVLFIYDNSTNICAFEWSPTEDLFAITDSNGTLNLFDDVMKGKVGEGWKAWDIPKFSSYEEDVKIDSMGSPLQPSSKIDAENITQLNHGSSHVETDLNSNNKKWYSEGEIGEGLEEDLESLPDHYNNANPGGNDPFDILQEPFQPGSTQVSGSEWQFLTYNEIGFISAFFDGNQTNYKVSFHSVDTYQDYNFNPFIKFDLASLGPSGALFAKKLNDDQKASIHYYPHNSNFKANDTWAFELEEDEDIINICSTLYGPVVFTSFNYIRRFSHYGAQIDLTMAPTPKNLTLCTNNDNLLFAIYHASTDINNLRLGYKIFDIESNQIMSEGFITLTFGTALEWIGFSENNVPAYSDSKGNFCILVHAYQPSLSHWKPILKINPSRLFPFGLSDTHAHCLKISPDPSWVSEPHAVMIPFNIPLLNPEDKSTSLEVKYQLAKINTELTKDFNSGFNTTLIDLEPDQLKELKMLEDRALLILIQNACKVNDASLALELILKINNLENLEHVKTIALTYNTLEVVRRIEDISKEMAASREILDDTSVIMDRRIEQDNYRASKIDTTPFQKNLDVLTTPTKNNGNYQSKNTFSPINERYTTPKSNHHSTKGNYDYKSPSSSKRAADFYDNNQLKNNKEQDRSKVSRLFNTTTQNPSYQHFDTKGKTSDKENAKPKKTLLLPISDDDDI